MQVSNCSATVHPISVRPRRRVHRGRRRRRVLLPRGHAGRRRRRRLPARVRGQLGVPSRPRLRAQQVRRPLPRRVRQRGTLPRDRPRAHLLLPVGHVGRPLLGLPPSER